MDIDGFAVQNTMACHEQLWFTKMCCTAMKYCKLCCRGNGVHMNSICQTHCLMYYGTALCSVTQWLHGACQKKGMLVHTMQQIVHSQEKICDKCYNMIIKYITHKGYPFQASVFQSPRVTVSVGCCKVTKFNYLDLVCIQNVNV